MDKEELRQRLENPGEDWGTLEKTGELRGRLRSSSDSREAPGTKNSKGEHREGIVKSARRRDSCRETGRAVGKLASLSRTEGTSLFKGMSSARRSSWFLWKATKLPWYTKSSTDNLFSRTFLKSSSGFSDLNKAESTIYNRLLSWTWQFSGRFSLNF